MLGIAIHCIQHSQAMLERGVCELAHSFFHFILNRLPLQIELHAYIGKFDCLLNIKQNLPKFISYIQISVQNHGINI